MLFKLVLLTVLNLMKASTNLNSDSSEDELTQYCQVEENKRPCQIAQDISDVVEDHAVNYKLPFDGPAAKESTAMALLGIAWHESGFQEAVQNCKKTGDNGKSVSMYQLHKGASWYDLILKDEKGQAYQYKQEEICSDNKLATRLSLHALLKFSKYPRNMFYSYAGNDGKPSKAGKELYRDWITLLVKNGYQINHKKSPRWIEKI